MSVRTKRVSWVALLLLLSVVLAVGASRPGAAPTPSQRMAAIDSDLRCPSCEDISVADSSASTAVAIRALVAARVHAGESTSQIESFLESRYGEGILLRPPVSGGTAALWVVPVVLVSASVVSLSVFFWRRRSVVPVPVAEEDRALVRDALERTRLDV